MTDPAPGITAAFSSGWLVAQLYGPLLNPNPPAPLGLPMISELAPADQIDLALRELGAHVKALDLPLSDPPRGTFPQVTGTMAGSDVVGYQKELMASHRSLLIALTVADRRLGAAYSLGQCLSGACFAKDENDFLLKFSKERLSYVQSALGELGEGLAPLSAGVVALSLKHWESWLEVNAECSWSVVRVATAAQGEQWRSLLSGEKKPQDLLTPQAYVQAGEAALRRAGQIVRRCIAHFWFPMIIVVLLAAGGVVLAVRDASGSAKVWASIVSVAAGLGITGKGIQSAASRLGGDVGRPLLSLTQTDAIAYSATWLPATPTKGHYTKLEAYRLRRRGVALPSPDVASRAKPPG